jgi:hypothetical protein
MSLRASGVIFGSNAFITSGKKYPPTLSTSDMQVAAENIYKKIQPNLTLPVKYLSSQCEKEFRDGFELVNSIPGSCMMLRFFLNTDTTTEDRTYLPLHLLEIATVTIEGNEMKINSVISKDEFKEKLNNILPGVSVKYFTL